MAKVERCEQCGFAWDLVPAAELPSRLVASITGLRRRLLPVERPAGWAQRAATRPSPEVWSALEYACHLRDLMFTQRERLYRALVEDDPEPHPMYREERVVLGRYAEQDLAEVVDQLEMVIRLFARDIAQLDPAQLERGCVYAYPTRARRTLLWLGAQTLHEILHHTSDIVRVLPRFADAPYAHADDHAHPRTFTHTHDGHTHTHTHTHDDHTHSHTHPHDHG